MNDSTTRGRAAAMAQDRSLRSSGGMALTPVGLMKANRVTAGCTLLGCLLWAGLCFFVVVVTAGLLLTRSGGLTWLSAAASRRNLGALCQGLCLRGCWGLVWLVGGGRALLSGGQTVRPAQQRHRTSAP